jgi:hypothetical protein
MDNEYIAPGWGCCHCNTYNGIQRTVCRHCEQPHCQPLNPDIHLGTTFKTRIHHFPRMFEKREGTNDNHVDIYALDVPPEYSMELNTKT